MTGERGHVPDRPRSFFLVRPPASVLGIPMFMGEVT